MGERKGQARRHNDRVMSSGARGPAGAGRASCVQRVSRVCTVRVPRAVCIMPRYANRRAQRRACPAARGGEHGAGRARECRGRSVVHAP
jgi:hypothetical protein